jgi:hypothetical protein
MTWGSSSCPHLPTSVRADRPGQLLISTAGDLYSGGMCTADLSVTTSIVRLPAGIDSSRRLAVQINKTRVTLPARVECGAWAAQDSAQARAVLATRGRLTSCELIGRTWMVTTVSAHRPGEVGLLTCSAGDQACLDGDRPHDLTAFTWISAPKKVGPGLKLYGGTGPNGPVFIYTTARHGQIKFDLARGTFTVCPHGVCRW